MSGETHQVVPFSLNDAPSFIEHLFPAQKISVEAQKERKAGAGQTLTALGSYWKGRKPLILARACVLGALLPATDEPEKDLAVFEKLIAIDDDAFEFRVKKKSAWPDILAKPYKERVKKCYRPEEIPDSAYDGIWSEVNRHLGTNANGFANLVEQLGIMRFGHRPSVADTFAGGGSIPFEAARLGCDVFASDLNPVACMLTWAALHVIGASDRKRQELRDAQENAVQAVAAKLDSLGVERNERGDEAKAYLYCLETRCPKTGWRVPLSPSWVVGTKQRAIAKLLPNYEKKSFDIEILTGVSVDDLRAAKAGTVRSGSLVYELDGEIFATPLKTVRGDYKGARKTGNRLRPWELSDFEARENDVFKERLYCIQWMAANTGDIYYAAPSKEDIQREEVVVAFVEENLQRWQAQGMVPDTLIEPGKKTDEPIRTRGWSFWHHLFNARQLLYLALMREQLFRHPAMGVFLCKCLDRLSRLCRYDARNVADAREPKLQTVFYNQAFNTLYNYGCRSFVAVAPHLLGKSPASQVFGQGSVNCEPAASFKGSADLFITDPPYGDAVVYDEITEFFIAWLRRDPPEPFSSWTWDSRRALAIRGAAVEFRHKMVEAYTAMAKHMPDNGLQIVMFTHQSGKVWADMAQIFWGAGLQVMAAWYIATETTSELKKGGYVQGTVILVLRKRRSDVAGYRDEIVQEIKIEVARQIDTMVGLNQSLKGHGRVENLFEDADLQMAGYAAALRVLTAYARIDGTDMTREALRPRQKDEESLVANIIEFAVQVANEHLVPEGMDAHVWERISGSERFYLKMLDIETTGAKKLDNYQNFAKAFRVPDYTALMHSLKPNSARLRNAVQFKKAGFDQSEFGGSPTRAALFALYELQADVEGDTVLGHLRDLVGDYTHQRETLIAIASYINMKRQDIDEAEAKAARILHGLIRNERLGA